MKASVSNSIKKILIKIVVNILVCVGVVFISLWRLGGEKLLEVVC